MLTQFCLESKIRHSTIYYLIPEHQIVFCLESKIRHSTIISLRNLCAAVFCLESKIRHSTMVMIKNLAANVFCLESKIRHSTIGVARVGAVHGFCLESKIRHSTIDTVPYFYVQRLIKKYGVRYFYQRSICWGRETSCRGQDLPWKTNILSHWIFVTKRQRTEPSGGIIFWILREWVAILSWVTHARA